MDDLFEETPSGTAAFAFADDTTFGAQSSGVTDCEVALQPLQTSCTDGVKYGKCHLA